ncbi:MAG TPA: RHS repeat-associated core domain-containing protein [Dermatophilaceae bacterium]|nr:RHS repeat-associated core domain-containing protein [Dermatophilaceae bacterium]
MLLVLVGAASVSRAGVQVSSGMPGNVATVGYGQATSQANTYDALGALTAVSVTGPAGQSVSRHTYTRNALGQVATTTGPDTTHTFGYSPLNRLAEDGTGTDASTVFTHDTVGNRTALAQSTGTGTADLSYDAGRQPTTYTPSDGAAIALQYDAQGNRLTGPAADGSGSATYTYDQVNQLRSVASAGGLASYTHDAAGLTATQATAAGTLRFAWSADAVPQLLTVGATSYLYDDTGLPLEQVTATGSVAFYQHDQYGSTTTLTSTTGATLATYDYSPDGLTTTHTGVLDTPLQWAGQYLDAVSGPYNLRARYYDPTTAQFLTRDPLESATGAPYTDADNDPVILADPTGLCPLCVTMILGAVLGAGLDRGTQVLGNLSNGCDPFHDINWGQVAVSGLAGAATGIAGKALTGLRAAKSADEFVDLASAVRRNHILYGDATGGGHMWPGLPGKTPFPKSWSGDRIMHETSDVATDPGSIHRTGRGGSTIVTGSRDGVDVRVILRDGDIITGYPTSLLRNP